MEIEKNYNNAHKIKLDKVLKKKALKTEIFHRIQGCFIPIIYAYLFLSKKVFPKKLSALDDKKSEHIFSPKRQNIREEKNTKIILTLLLSHRVHCETKLFGYSWCT